MNKKPLNLLKSLLYLLPVFFLLLSSPEAFSQIPQDTPHPKDNEPLQLDNWTNLIVYIILPVFLLIVWFLLRMRRKRKNH